MTDMKQGFFRRFWMIVPIILIGVWMLKGFIWGAKKGTPAPVFNATLNDGTAFSLSDLKDHYVLLDFWGSWCGPCRKEAPHLVTMNEKYKGKNFSDAKGFEVVSVALERNDRSWQKAAKKLGFNWDYQVVQISKAVALAPIARQYGVTNIPSKFLIGPDGTLLATNPSFGQIDEILSQKIQ